ncbi:hypothetical protein ACFL1H_07735 [Nanoarchaeota archaeon]
MIIPTRNQQILGESFYLGFEEFLDKDEEIILTFRPRKKDVRKAAAYCYLGSLSVGIGCGSYIFGIELGKPALLSSMAFYTISAYNYFKTKLELNNERYALTTKKVIKKEGIFSETVFILSYDNIDDVIIDDKAGIEKEPIRNIEIIPDDYTPIKPILLENVHNHRGLISRYIQGKSWQVIQNMSVEERYNSGDSVKLLERVLEGENEI